MRRDVQPEAFEMDPAAAPRRTKTSQVVDLLRS
jgi:hypothetical protein